MLSPRDDDLWPKPDGDPMDFAERMLRNASSGRTLGESFAKLAHAATEALGVKAFILGIDDVDTAFERGWLVLETLRKYLATPRLITVLSGGPAQPPAAAQPHAASNPGWSICDRPASTSAS